MTEGLQGGQLKLLTKSQLHDIHQATLEVLKNPGISVNEPNVVKILDDMGAEVDFDQNRVHISESLVKEAINKAPSEFTVYARDPKNNLRMGGNRVYFSPISTQTFIFDLETEERRPTRFSDCENLVKLNDFLDMVHGNACSVHPNDVSEVAAHAYMMLACAKNTTKCFRGRNYGKQVARDCIEIAAALAGGEEELRKKPDMITVMNSVSPLQHERKQLEGFLEYLRMGMPMCISSEVSAGATGPVTLAGSMVVLNAEVLTGIVIAQSVNPGNPVLYGTTANIMDMRTAQMSEGSVETGLLNIATAQLAHYYNIPCRGSAGSTDSKVLDMEAGYETALNLLLATMAGVNYIQEGVGGLDLTLSVSYEKFLIDNEILRNIERAVRGIEVSDRTLAVELIQKVGPGRHYISQKHTLAHLKEEHVIPELADRKKYETWESEDRKDIKKRAREKVKRILKDHEPEPLDKDIEKRIRDIVKKIEKREVQR